MKILKKKITEANNNSGAYGQRESNSLNERMTKESIASRYNGYASGIFCALFIIGMLDKKITKQINSVWK